MQIHQEIYRKCYINFRHYVVICAMAANSKQLLQWSGLVESKIRVLIGQLESNEAFQSVHIYPRSYDAPHTTEEQDGEGSSVGSIWFVGLDLKKSGEISITGEAQLFINAGQYNNMHVQTRIHSLSLSQLIHKATIMIWYLVWSHFSEFSKLHSFS